MCAHSLYLSRDVLANYVNRSAVSTKGNDLPFWISNTNVAANSGMVCSMTFCSSIIAVSILWKSQISGSATFSAACTGAASSVRLVLWLVTLICSRWLYYCHLIVPPLWTFLPLSGIFLQQLYLPSLRVGHWFWAYRLYFFISFYMRPSRSSWFVVNRRNRAVCLFQ